MAAKVHGTCEQAHQSELASTSSGSRRGVEASGAVTITSVCHADANHSNSIQPGVLADTMIEHIEEYSTIYSMIKY